MTLFKEAKIDFSNWQLNDLGYLAGIIDGEGCLNIYTCNSLKKRRSWTYCRLTINTTDENLRDWLKEKLDGGGINKERRKKPKPHHKQVYTFLIAAQKELLNLLYVIEPYLIIKKTKARECIEFLETKIA